MRKTIPLIFRKIAKTALVLSMLFGILVTSFPYAVSLSPDDTGDAPSLPFTDVDLADWFYEQVRDVFEQGLMTGTGDATFSPGTRVTRAMAVQVLYNHSGQPEASWWFDENPFTDVAESAWYYDAVVWAANWGMVSGFGDGTFAPGAYITRAHLVVLLNNYARAEWLELPPQRESQVFVDYMDIRNYAKEAIDRFFRAMIINGRPDGRFDPQGKATRAELATMLSQFVKYSGERVSPQPPYGFPCCCDDMLPPGPAYGVPDPEPPYDYPMPEYGFPCWD